VAVAVRVGVGVKVGPPGVIVAVGVPITPNWRSSMTCRSVELRSTWVMVLAGATKPWKLVMFAPPLAGSVKFCVAVSLVCTTTATDPSMSFAKSPTLATGCAKTKL